MDKLKDFSSWMMKNSGLAESSVYKYTRAVRTVSIEMVEQRIINKSLLEMNLVELDIAILNILGNAYFIEKNTRGKRMYSNALKQYRYFVLESAEDDEEEKNIEKEIYTSDLLSETEKQTLIKARVGQDRLFDSGLISFTDEGQMLISSFVGAANVSRLHISNEMRVNLRATTRLLAYLEYHRDVLFVK